MIKINLLHAKKGKGKGKAGGQREIIISVVAVVCLLGLLGLVQWKLGKEKEETFARIQKTKEDIKYYNALIAQAQKDKEKQKTLQEILDVINSLRKEKSFASRVMEEVSVQKPEKLQLESLRKEGSRLGIDGVALDDETVANFMTNLRKSKVFKNVDLVVSEQFEQSKVKLKKFTLSCEISPL
jgi:type IV pilus assembly protein PilN